jgi:MFS family permease
MLLIIIAVVTGWFCDRVRLRGWPFLGALVIQTAVTLMLCLATSIAVLLSARILQGASGGVVWTVSLIIMSIGVVIGPLFGGILYERAGYYSIFALSFAFLAVDGAFRLTFIEAQAASKWEPAACLVAPSPPYQCTEEPLQDQSIEKGPSQPLRLASSVVIAVPLRRFAHRIHRQLPPTITLLGDVRLDISLWGCFLQAVFLSGFDATIPIFVSRTFRWNSLAAGLIFLALVIPTCLSPVVGRVSDKHGPRWYTAAGYVLSTIPLMLLRYVHHDSTARKYCSVPCSRYSELRGRCLRSLCGPRSSDAQKYGSRLNSDNTAPPGLLARPMVYSMFFTHSE